VRARLIVIRRIRSKNADCRRKHQCCLAKKAIQPIDAAIQSNLRETTTRVLASLTPREERILRMRFGIGMNKDHTLESVGQQFSVTRERIRQIEAKALRKLKHPSRSRILRSFLDNG
jgi:RNA polymerase primary sigma factor